MRVETDSPYRLKETFSSGTSATAKAGATSVFESLPERKKKKNRMKRMNNGEFERDTTLKLWN